MTRKPEGFDEAIEFLKDEGYVASAEYAEFLDSEVVVVRDGNHLTTVPRNHS